MSIKRWLHYDRKKNFVFGYEDNGEYRSNKLANSALCFMASGCVSKWKQMIGYVLTDGCVSEHQILKLLKESISALEKEGFSVLGTTTDLGQNFQATFKLLGVTSDRPFFHKGNKQYLDYKDPPHLLKCSRNFLLNQEVYIPNFSKDKQAKWSHLVDLFKLNSMHNLVLAPKISRKHLFDLKFQNKMKVNLAAQVLSHSCSAALDFFSAFSIMETEVLATSCYCKNFNDLFDILNSSCYKDPVSLRRSLYPMSSSWIKLQELKTWLQNLSHINTKRPRFINGWIQSINVICRLFPILQKLDAKFFSTRNICQDPVELFFLKLELC